VFFIHIAYLRNINLMMTGKRLKHIVPKMRYVIKKHLSNKTFKVVFDFTPPVFVRILDVFQRC